ncbi:aminoacyl-tRNA hydrolase, partial [Streptococcus suis]
MYIIAGLGNPTREYEKTRHNVGFEAVDVLADKLGSRVTEKKHKAFYGTGRIGLEKVILSKPQTFMNLSGESIR